MAQHLPRVIRVYSLPIEQFDYLKTYQRVLQRAADAEAGRPAFEGDPHWIDNSKALAHILKHHGLFSMAAGAADMRVADYGVALYRGDLKTVSPQELPA